MPLFMFISGYLFYLSLTKNGKTIKDLNIKIGIKKKFQRLLIPYFVISSLAFLPKFILNKYAVRPVAFDLKCFINGFLYPTENPIIFFWFLPTLFIIMILVMIILRKLRDINVMLLIVTLVIGIISRFYIHVSILNISGCLNYLFFFVLGMYVKKNYYLILKSFQKRNMRYVITSVLFLILTILDIYTYNFVDSFSGVVKSVYYYFVGTVGISFSFCLAYFYELNDYNFFKKLYGTSYSIYLLSWFPQVFIRILWFQILKYNSLVGTILSFICGVLIPVIVNKIVKKYFSRVKFIRVLFGV